MVSARTQASIPITGVAGNAVGYLDVHLLPSTVHESQPAPLLVSDDLEPDDLPRVQLLEGTEYLYEFRFVNPEGVVATDRPEVFQPDTASGVRGRLRPALYTGTLPVVVRSSGGIDVGRFSVEVRSRKLNYLSEYRWMLRDIAEHMTEIVMERFAVAEREFAIDDTRDAETLYERFAFLKSLVSGEAFQAAIQRILTRPHVAWETVSEPSGPGRGLRADSNSIRQISRPGSRVHWPNGKVKTLPATVYRRQTFSTTDTTPNRFVKFALIRWREVLTHMAAIVADDASSEARSRATRDIAALTAELDSYLAAELFREAGELNRFPADDQAIQKREGYRDIFRAYVQFELAARLSWTGGNDVYGAGQKDVATLYEYWAFLQLAGVLAELLDVPFDSSALIELRQNGFNVALKNGQRSVLTGIAYRNGRALSVSLWFNRTYGTRQLDGTWTLNMRPDCSIEVRPAPTESATFEPVILHFDAKYRISLLKELFGDADDVLSGNDPRSSSEAKRADLLKMHAYRDAVKRSVGAYVLYPGTEDALYREYQEILPGLGAFPLRPVDAGVADGAIPIKVFLEEVLEHVALQVTQHERGRYWLREAYDSQVVIPSRAPVARFLSAPPADTLVLLGFVKNELHWNWVLQTKRYNLRAYGHRGFVGVESKKLACDIVILSCPSLGKTRMARLVGRPEIIDKERMEGLGYPDPRGHYFCFTLDLLPEDQLAGLISTDVVEGLRANMTQEKGAPIALTWLDLVKAL